MTRGPDRDPMHDVVAGETENLLNSGVVAGGESFREGVVGSGFGLSGKPAGPQHMGSASLRRMATGAMANELDDTDEFEGVRDAYDAADGGLAIRRRVARRKAKAKAAETSPGDGAAARAASGGKARGAASADDSAAAEQAAQMRAKANGAAGAAKSASTGTAQAGIATEMSAQAAGAQVANASSSAAAAAATAEGGAGVAGAIAGAGAPIAGIVTGIVAFALGVLLVGQIVSALFGFWENEANKQAMEGLPPYITYEMVEAVLDAQEKYGHPAGCTIAQIICESGQGDHMSQLATRDHNLFGMKWTSSYASAAEVAGKASWATGEEAADGSHYTTSAQFIVFKGDAECIGFRSRVFLQAGRYANNPLIREAMANHNSDKMAEGLKDAGWATDSSYVETLKSIMQTYGLYRFDGLSLEDFKAGEEAGNAIVAAAYSQLGVPYVWGGSTPGKGLDCSGLTQYCYRQAGIRISHYTEDQKSELRQIPVSQAKPGDILYRHGHVAIYIGDDRYIHEPRTGDVCRIASGVDRFTCALTARH